MAPEKTRKRLLIYRSRVNLIQLEVQYLLNFMKPACQTCIECETRALLNGRQWYDYLERPDSHYRGKQIDKLYNFHYGSDV